MEHKYKLTGNDVALQERKVKAAANGKWSWGGIESKSKLRRFGVKVTFIEAGGRNHEVRRGKGNSVHFEFDIIMQKVPMFVLWRRLSLSYLKLSDVSCNLKLTIWILVNNVQYQTSLIQSIYPWRLPTSKPWDCLRHRNNLPPNLLLQGLCINIGVYISSNHMGITEKYLWMNVEIKWSGDHVTSVSCGRITPPWNPSLWININSFVHWQQKLTL